MSDVGAPRTVAPADAASVRRRQILDLVRKRVRPGSGSTVTFLRARTWSDPDVDLHRLRTPFVVVGAVATWLYMPQRATKDVDILVLARDAPSLHRELTSAGSVRVGSLTVGGTSWETPEGELDVIESSEPWAEAAVAFPNRSPTGLPVIALPYLVLMKLQASRAQDLADLVRMLALADEPTRGQVRDVVRRFEPGVLEDIESMIALGELELRTPERAPDE